MPFNKPDYANLNRSGIGMLMNDNYSIKLFQIFENRQTNKQAPAHMGLRRLVGAGCLKSVINWRHPWIAIGECRRMCGKGAIFERLSTFFL